MSRMNDHLQRRKQFFRHFDFHIKGVGFDTLTFVGSVFVYLWIYLSQTLKRYEEEEEGLFMFSHLVISKKEAFTADG